jgi:ATP-binding cassette, subfamily B, bacterial MsbA
MSSLQRILSYTKKYWQRLLTSIVAATLFGLFAAAPTYLLKHAVDHIFVNHNTKIIIPFIIVFVSLFAFKGVFMYISAYYMHWVGNRVVNDIRSDLFEKIIYFPLSFYKKKHTGELMSHFLNDIAHIQNASSNAVKHGVRSLFEALALISVALFANWRLALMTSFIAPFIGITILYMGRAVKAASRSIQGEMGSMSSVLQEIFVGIREVKIFNAESFEKDRFVKKLQRYFSSVMRNVKIEALGPAFMEAVAMLGAGFVFYIAAKQVLSGSISPGQLTSFFAASLLAYQPIKRLVNLYAEVQYGLAAAERVFSLMDITYPALQERTITAPSFNDEINFKNISFSYDSDNPVLQNVNLTIKKGERIGLLGPSGSGKSTFCDLLLGFIVPTSGKILVDGNDITKFKLHSLHNLIGSVSQQTFLFNDSVETNVAYAQKNVEKSQLFDACKRAHASEFIENMPEQYQTFVGENGSRLSGGQKQRLTIARVLLKDPDVLIFDEATSSLDTKSEEMIRLALNDICKTKTVIVVSHRVSFIEKMDRIFTIQNGQFVEIGKGTFEKNPNELFL